MRDFERKVTREREEESRIEENKAEEDNEQAAFVYYELFCVASRGLIEDHNS